MKNRLSVSSNFRRFILSSLFYFLKKVWDIEITSILLAYNINKIATINETNSFSHNQ